MPPKKTPKSLLTGNFLLFTARQCVYSCLFRSVAIRLLALQVWYLVKAWILLNASPKALAAHSSAATRLPQDVAEMIIGLLIYDTQSLLACSLTCRSWYIASVPHLHHTLATRPGMCLYKRNLEWPKPLQNANKFGLLHLVKRLSIENGFDYNDSFSLKRFNDRILSHFSTLRNVQELQIVNMDTSSFMPNLRQFFGHFLPTVRSLALNSPIGSNRDIIFFIGLFQHLEDLTLRNVRFESRGGDLQDDLTLIPSSSPPLRGRLIVLRVKRFGFLKDMIHLLGGFRFKHVHLFDVGETRLLLNTCAETLETLRLYPTDPRGE